MKPADYKPVVNGLSPRLQIIRGVPGTGKSSLAKTYPCIHVELDQFCCRAGAYRWGEQRDRDGHAFVGKQVKHMMKEGMDIVVSGVFAKPENQMGILVYMAMMFGYEVWICDMLNEHGNVHGCRWQDMEKFRQAFVPYTDATYGEGFNRFAVSNPGDLKLSKDAFDALVAFSKEHIHSGLMPKDYPNVPEPDGV